MCIREFSRDKKEIQRYSSSDGQTKILGNMAKESADYGGGIKDSWMCFTVFRAVLTANPQAGILGGGTQLGNNRCQ